jgi:probable HAF family extracellular repeat protein
MNQRGQVVGQSNLVGDLTYHPFLWNHGVMTDLGTLGGDTGLANWINDSGYIAGKADLAGSPPQNHHATLWKDEVVTDLGVFPGDSCSNAYFVNNKGQVVGTSEDRTDCSLSVGAHAFLWQQGGPMVNLNTLVPPDSPLNLTYAVAINDRGEIAGFGVPAACAVESYEYCGHAYVMIPCDENHPGMEGCDYRLVDASAGVEVSAVHAATLPTAAVNNNAPVGQQGQFRGRFAQPFPGFGVQQQK